MPVSTIWLLRFLYTSMTGKILFVTSNYETNSDIKNRYLYNSYFELTCQWVWIIPNLKRWKRVWQKS